MAKLGYYKLEDGSKSTDPENAQLLKVKKKRSTLNATKASASSDDGELDVRSAPQTKKAAKIKEAKAEAKPEKKQKQEVKASTGRGKALPKQQEAATIKSRSRSPLPKKE